MGSLPLHPALVHVPLGLAAVIPLVAFALVAAQWRRGLTRRAWTLVVGLQAILLAGGIAAQRTGGAEEDRVEPIVGEAALERHEEAAEAFLVGAGVALALAGLVLVLPPRAVRAGAVAASLATVAVAGLALRTGHAGGRLVYEAGAARAYATGSASSTVGGATAAESEVGRGPDGKKADDDDR